MGKEIFHVLIIIAALGTVSLLLGFWVGDWALVQLDPYIDQYITKMFR